MRGEARDVKLTRREVLSSVAALGALVARPEIAGAQGSLPRRQRLRPGPTPSFVATRDAFLQHVNQVFRVYRPGRTMYGIGLVAVLDGAAARAARTEGSQYCFTAMFVGPAADPLPEGTYDVATPAWAALPLFLKRSMVQDGFQYYESAFNGLPPE